MGLAGCPGAHGGRHWRAWQSAVLRGSPERIETGIDDLSLAEIRKGEYVSQL